MARPTFIDPAFEFKVYADVGRDWPFHAGSGHACC